MYLQGLFSRPKDQRRKCSAPKAGGRKGERDGGTGRPGRRRGREGERAREYKHIYWTFKRETKKMKACGGTGGGVRPCSSAQLPQSRPGPFPKNAKPALPSTESTACPPHRSQTSRSGALSLFSLGKIKFMLRPAPSVRSYFVGLVCELKSLAKDRACPQLPGTGPIRTPAGGLECLVPPAPAPPGAAGSSSALAPGLGPQSLGPALGKASFPRGTVLPLFRSSATPVCPLPRAQH